MKAIIWFLALLSLGVTAVKPPKHQATGKEMDAVLAKLSMNSTSHQKVAVSRNMMSYYCVGEAYQPFFRTKVFKDVPHCSIDGWTQSISFMAYNTAMEGTYYFISSETQPQSGISEGVDATILGCSASLSGSSEAVEWWMDNVTTGPPDVKLTYNADGFMGATPYTIITTIDRDVGSGYHSDETCSFGTELTWGVMFPVTSDDAKYVASIAPGLVQIWKRDRVQVSPADSRLMLRVIQNAISTWEDDVLENQPGAKTLVEVCSKSWFREQLDRWGLSYLCTNRKGKVDRTKIRIDRQTTYDRDGYSFVNLHLQIDGRSYAAVQVPAGYPVGARAIRRALLTSQSRAMVNPNDAIVTMTLSPPYATGGPNGGPVPPADMPTGINYIGSLLLIAVSFMVKMGGAF